MSSSATDDTGTIIVFASLAGFFLVSYFIFALMILKMKKFKTEISVIISMLVFVLNFLVKFFIQLMMIQDNQKFLVTNSSLMILIEFSMSHAVILNLYYFAYSMRSVKDTIESKSHDDFTQK